MGPLGPVGAHGYKADENGNYINNDEIVRTIEVEFDNGLYRTFELYEMYSEYAAKCLVYPDSSYFVLGSISDFGEKDTYPVLSKEDQFVTIVVVPDFDTDSFGIAVYDTLRNLIASSETKTYINTIQLMVPANFQIHVTVELKSSWQPFVSSYRLYVTGSLENLNQHNISGDHINHWYHSDVSASNFVSTLNAQSECKTF